MAPDVSPSSQGDVPKDGSQESSVHDDVTVEGVAVLDSVESQQEDNDSQGDDSDEDENPMNNDTSADGYAMLTQLEDDEDEDNSCVDIHHELQDVHSHNHIEDSSIREIASDSTDCVTSLTNVCPDSLQCKTEKSPTQDHFGEGTNLRSAEMTTAKVEVIKNVMAGFNIPTNNIPDWAKVIPEDKWKEKLTKMYKE
eukprot:gene19868-21810_t